MAQIPVDNPRYRTKQELSVDVAKVLCSDLHHGTQFAVLKEVTWVWTEFTGKFNGCHYWTAAALRRFKRESSRKRLRHEHVVPKKVVIEMLFALDKPTAEKVRTILDKFLIGVVVTKEQDARLNAEYGKSMPPEFYDESSPLYQDPWLRYRKCNIKVRFMPQQTTAIVRLLSKVVATKGMDFASLLKLEESLDRNGWFDHDFDWSRWSGVEEYVRTPEMLETAGIEVVRRLLTLHFRKERTCEGHLAHMITVGHFKSLLRRLRELRRVMSYE